MGVILWAQWVNLEVPINCVLLGTFLGSLEFVFSFFGGHAMCALWVNLEVPINCVLLKHWNKYVFPFWCHSARAQWVNLEVAINCVILEHWNNIFSLFGGYSIG